MPHTSCSSRRQIDLKIAVLLRRPRENSLWPEGDVPVTPRDEDDVLAPQLSYFADQGAQAAVVKQLHDSPCLERLQEIAAVFDDGTQLRRPFAEWAEVEPSFRDLLCGLMNFDQKKRITVKEALAHPWFADVLGERHPLANQEVGWVKAEHLAVKEVQAAA